MQPLDIITLPLNGMRLIEASAGTGKTYTLAGLYLRLLLGLGKKAAFKRPLTVEEILVVTFTEAATQELKERIRNNIQKLRLACLHRKSDEPLLQQLLAEIVDYELAMTLLLVAERQMDCAAIYTIHGFCQRVLQDYAFEVAVGFDFSIMEDESVLQLQAILDFWRSYCYPLSVGEMQVFYDCWATPYALQQELKTYLGRIIPTFAVENCSRQDIQQWHQLNFEAIEQVKQNWLQNLSEITTTLETAQLNRRSYNKKNLPNWLDKVTLWANTATVNFELISELKRFSFSTLTEMTLSGEAPQLPLFVEIDALLNRNFNPRCLLLPYILEQVNQRLATYKLTLKTQGFMDLLTHVDEALKGVHGEQLAITIR